MITYLKEQKVYENRYDHATVEQCLSGESLVNAAFRQMEEIVPASELEEYRAAWYIEYSKYYMYFVEFIAAGRYYKRDSVIAEWMECDGQKDRRLADARLPKTPFCLTCGQDMEAINKLYMHRDDGKHDEDEIIFILNCASCGKRRTYWEDGSEWDGVKILCEKCQAEMIVTNNETEHSLVSTYVCTSCNHSYEETIVFKKRPADKESQDSHYTLDRKRFCFDEETMHRFEAKLERLARLAKVYADATIKTESADVYGVIKDIKQLKIIQLIELLRPVFEKAHYTEFKLGEPQLGESVTVEFSCLDASADRQEYQSKTNLRKAAATALDETNWRLMNDSVSYRLGYLTGKLRAYEGEEALKKFVEQRIKDGTLKPEPPKFDTSTLYDIDKLDKVELIKIIAENERLQYKTTPIENGTKRPDCLDGLVGKLHPDLRLVVPIRDNDDLVPGFVRNFDYTVEHYSIIEKARPKRKKETVKG